MHLHISFELLCDQVTCENTKQVWRTAGPKTTWKLGKGFFNLPRLVVEHIRKIGAFSEINIGFQMVPNVIFHDQYLVLQSKQWQNTYCEV